MITEYHRPVSLEEALSLIAQPDTLPLGGGTLLSKPRPDPIEVVDLQALGLNAIRKQGNNLEIGATATLQQLLENEAIPEALKHALKLEAPLNLRNAATAAGTLVSADGRSPFVTVLQALDAKVTVTSGQPSAISVGDFLPFRLENLQGKLITSIDIPLNVKLAFESVSRTPSDKPIVCTALAQWPSGRTRLAIGGYGKAPLLAMDGTESEGFDASTPVRSALPGRASSAQAAARNSFHEATDEWASAEYRMDVAATLAKRCIEKI